MSEKPPKIDLKKVEEFVLANPGIMVAAIGLLSLIYMTSPSERPAWLKDCPPINPKRAGPWRGKGSFGKGFGANPVRHK